MSDFWRYERRQRIAVKDGVKTRTAKFATQWWAKQWLAALESFGWDNRLQRGRSYARSGQVLGYALAAGTVTARVQGSRRTPYRVEIRLERLDDAAWERVLDALAARAEFTARLLAGDIPHEIGEVFAAAGAALLPVRARDLATKCSCPDVANPCKHIAALHYVLAEALDADPFVLFALRGRGRDEVLDALRKRRGEADVPEQEAAPEVEPLTAEGFWKGRGDLSTLDVGLAPPRVRASVLRRLGPPGAWASSDEMVAVFGAVLRAGSEEALRAGLEG